MLSIHTLCSNPNLKLLSMFICPDWRSPSYGLSSLPFFQPLMPSCCLSSQPPLPKVILLNVGGREAHLATCDARAGRWWWWMREEERGCTVSICGHKQEDYWAWTLKFELQAERRAENRIKEQMQPPRAQRLLLFQLIKTALFIVWELSKLYLHMWQE